MKGKIAVCSQGRVGIITEDEQRPVTYGWDAAPSAMAHVGIHLGNVDLRNIGKPWSPRNPQILGDSKDMAVTYQCMKEAVAGYPPIDPEKM